MAMYPGTIDQLESGYTGMDQWDCIYLGDEKIWPTSTHLTPIVEQISAAWNKYPVHFCEFNGNTNQTYLKQGSGSFVPQNFGAMSGAGTFVEGVAGRKALQCQSTDIYLSNQAKAPTNVSISMLIKQTSTNSSYSGILGGTIFGLNTEEFGYALGWSPSIQSNKFCAECYCEGGKGASAVYSSSSVSTNKWYHVMITYQANILKSTISINGSTWDYGANANGLLGNIGYGNLYNSSLHLGCVWQSGKNYFKGLIQDFVLWRDVSLYDNPSLAKLIVDYYKGLNIL